MLLKIQPTRRRFSPVRREVNAPDRDLIGETCRAISFQGSEGRVRFREGSWQAHLTNWESAEPDALLRVAGLRGTVLLVSIADAAAPLPIK